MATDWRETLEELSDVALPVSLAYEAGRTTYAEYRSAPLELKRGKRYAVTSVAGRPGRLVVGETAVATGTVASDGESFDVSSASEDVGAVLPSAMVRVVASAGRAWRHASQAALRVGETIVLDQPADRPVEVFFPGTERVWMTGEVVTVDESFGVRLLAKHGGRRSTPDKPDHLQLEVLIGEAVFDLEEYAAVGEGTVCPLEANCREPMVLRCGAEPVGYGFLTVDATSGHLAFVVTAVPGPRSVSAEKRAPSPETDRVDLLALLSLLPAPQLLDILAAQPAETAGWLSKALAIGSHGAAAAVLASLVERVPPESVPALLCAFVEAEPAAAAASVRSSIAEALLAQMSPEDAQTFASQAANVPNPLDALGQDPTDLGGRFGPAARVVTSLPEAIAAELFAALGNDDAAELRRRCPLFEDIPAFSDRDIQKVLREVDMHDLAAALVGATEEARTSVERNMSKRAARMLAEEIDYASTFSPAARERSRQTIRRVVHELVSNGEVAL